jgi:two-component system cell cycle sensor histidine kinase/response regulator CckA
MPRRTAREEAELVAKLIENASDVIAVIDQNGTISFQSPSVERVLGYRPEELDGTSVFDLVHPDDLPGAGRRMAQVLAAQGPTRMSLIRLRHRDGSWRALEAVGTSMFDDPHVRGIVVNARDVTERLELERELREAQKLEAIGRLAGGIAHDFNNLLTVIGGYGELIAHGLAADDPLREDAEAIRQAAQRASELTRRLLAFSGRAVVEPRVLDPNEVVTGLLPTVQELVGREVEIGSDLDPAAGRVQIDQGQLEQVILNLAVNARDSMPHGGRLTVSTAPASLEPDERHLIAVPPGPYVRLSVSDTGDGVDDATREDLFEPFSTGNDPGPGVGLGLATVRRIVEESGGTIALDSASAAGTTFHVFLPVAGEEEAPPSSAPTSSAGGGGGETVLVVDDEALVRDLARRALEEHGYVVLVASGGAEALELYGARDGRIDLLLTDVVMPGVNGRELAELLTSRQPSIATLFMTGYTEDALLRHGLEQANVRLIHKPFSPQVLALRVREILDARAASAR